MSLNQIIIAYAASLMPGLHLQRNRRKSAIQEFYDGLETLTKVALLVEPDFYDGYVAQL